MTNPNKPSRQLWTFLRAVLFKPTWDFLATGTLFTTLFVLTWWRDNFASDELKGRLELPALLPHWNPSWWLCIGLLVLLFLVIREAYRLWTAQTRAIEQQKQLRDVRGNDGLPATAPQVTVTAENQPEMGLIQRLLLRNVSADPIYNLCMQPVRFQEEMVILWNPTDIPLLEGNTIAVMSPLIYRDIGGNTFNFPFVTAIMDVLRKESNKGQYSIGELAFSCEDKVQNRYLVTFKLEVNFQGNTLTIRDCDRRLIGNRPNTYAPWLEGT